MCTLSFGSCPDRSGTPPPRRVSECVVHNCEQPCSERTPLCCSYLPSSLLVCYSPLLASVWTSDKTISRCDECCAGMPNGQFSLCSLRRNNQCDPCTWQMVKACSTVRLSRRLQQVLRSEKMCQSDSFAKKSKTRVGRFIFLILFQSFRGGHRLVTGTPILNLTHLKKDGLAFKMKMGPSRMIR